MLHCTYSVCLLHEVLQYHIYMCLLCSVLPSAVFSPACLRHVGPTSLQYIIEFPLMWEWYWCGHSLHLPYYHALRLLHELYKFSNYSDWMLKSFMHDGRWLWDNISEIISMYFRILCMRVCEIFLLSICWSLVLWYFSVMGVNLKIPKLWFNLVATKKVQ